VFDLPEPARLVLHLDASDLSTLYQDPEMLTPVAADAQTVGAWMDKSGAGNHVFQSLSGRRPAYRTAIQNGRAALLFDGFDDFLRSTAFTLPQPFTVVVVHRLTKTTLGWLLCSVGSRIDLVVSNAGPGIYQWAGAGAPYDIQSGNVAQNGVGRCAIGVADLSRSSFRMGATRIPQGNVGPVGFLGLTLGAFNNDNFPTGAYICEVRIYAGVLSADQIDVLETELVAKWATS
jgi:hypothetical protein